MERSTQTLLMVGGALGAVALVGFAAYELTKPPTAALAAGTTTTTTTTAQTYTFTQAQAGASQTVKPGDTIVFQLAAVAGSTWGVQVTGGANPAGATSSTNNTTSTQTVATGSAATAPSGFTSSVSYQQPLGTAVAATTKNTACTNVFTYVAAAQTAGQSTTYTFTFQEWPTSDGSVGGAINSSGSPTSTGTVTFTITVTS